MPRKVARKERVTKPTYALGDDIAVTWRDCAAGVGWTSTPHNLHSIISTGFMVAETDDAITIASTADMSNGTVNRFEVIPRGCITAVEVRQKNALSPEFWLRG